MSEYDRGAYPPGGEPPLRFDPRRPQRPAGPAPVTLILSLMLLAAVGGGVFYIYRGGARGVGDAPRPVGAPVGDFRSAAPPQASTPDPAAGLSIYKDDPNAARAVPAFVPPPEQPTPRPN
ncbi:MAG: SPOR domain-containing protein, partial [Caulobacteraceae bacterium]